ncbi:hypothetical protein Alsa4_CDS0022 [Staphylococcus phage Alsa_4]|nr:hypothetical protein Alsa4_CDS0022 [Staphylococcus phage Alsa_4]
MHCSFLLILLELIFFFFYYFYQSVKYISYFIPVI